MNLRQLRYFYEIANEGQITRAAKKLHISQPPLSQSLKALETTLGVILFERNGRTMELTDAGSVLYKKAKDIFYKIDETIIEVKETGKGTRGVLRIGCNKSCFSHIPKKIKSYQKTFPYVTFNLIEGDSYHLTNKLLNREIELAVVRLPINMKGLSHQRLPDEEYVVVTPNNLIDNKSKTSISIQDIAELPLLLLHRVKGVGQFEIIMDKFRKQELKPNVICESPNVDMLLGLVNEGLGATIVPKSTLLKHNTSDVSVLKIKDTNIISESVIIWLKDRYLSKSAKQFIEMFEY